MSAFYDYQNNKDSNGQMKYNFLLLKSDLTYESDRINNKERLGHGGMIEGAIEDHAYTYDLNGQAAEGKLRDIYKIYVNQS